MFALQMACKVKIATVGFYVRSQPLISSQYDIKRNSMEKICHMLLLSNKLYSDSKKHKIINSGIGKYLYIRYI